MRGPGEFTKSRICGRTRIVSADASDGAGLGACIDKRSKADKDGEGVISFGFIIRPVSEGSSEVIGYTNFKIEYRYSPITSP